MTRKGSWVRIPHGPLENPQVRTYTVLACVDFECPEKLVLHPNFTLRVHPSMDDGTRSRPLADVRLYFGNIESMASTAPLAVGRTECQIGRASCRERVFKDV